MKRLLVLVLVMFAVAAYAETVETTETDPLLGLPLTGCTEDQILTVFEEKEFAPLLINKEGEYRGELCLGNESRELAVYVYDGNLKLIEVFWGIDSPSATQREKLDSAYWELYGIFEDATGMSGLASGTPNSEWSQEILFEAHTGSNAVISRKDDEDYVALAVEIRLNP